MTRLQVQVHEMTNLIHIIIKNCHIMWLKMLLEIDLWDIKHARVESNGKKSFRVPGANNKITGQKALPHLHDFLNGVQVKGWHYSHLDEKIAYFVVKVVFWESVSDIANTPASNEMHRQP